MQPRGPRTGMLRYEPAYGKLLRKSKRLGVSPQRAVANVINWWSSDPFLPLPRRRWSREIWAMVLDVRSAVNSVDTEETRSASLFQQAVMRELRARGFALESEYPVRMAGDRTGRIDVVASRADLSVGIELDWRQPRIGSVLKLLRFSGVRVVVLREPRSMSEWKRLGRDIFLGIDAVLPYGLAAIDLPGVGAIRLAPR